MPRLSDGAYWDYGQFCETTRSAGTLCAGGQKDRMGREGDMPSEGDRPGLPGVSVPGGPGVGGLHPSGERVRPTIRRSDKEEVSYVERSTSDVRREPAGPDSPVPSSLAECPDDADKHAMEGREPADSGTPETDRRGLGARNSRSPAWHGIKAVGIEEINSFGQLSIQDLEFLAVGAGTLRTGQTAQQILMAIASGKGYFLRITGPATGIITGQIFIHPGGKEFSMGIFAGKGIFPGNLERLADLIFEWARSHGCKWVRFENIHQSLDRHYTKYFDREATVFVKEIKDERG
jgi:hypothetical protein